MLAILEKPELLRRAVPLSVACYEKMAELGLVDERTELLRGVIFEKMSKSPLHYFLVDLLTERLKASLPAGQIVRTEAPLALSDSSPEPDLCVVPGPRSLYSARHPDSARLVIEVAISSEALDREKASIYAEAGVEEYWMVLPQRRIIERFSQPENGIYARHEVTEAEVTVVSLMFPEFSVNLDELLKSALVRNPARSGVLSGKLVRHP
ncbi:MAG: Uma2 family endonuclease [Verrucomicrobiota bacterium]